MATHKDALIINGRTWTLDDLKNHRPAYENLSLSYTNVTKNLPLHDEIAPDLPISIDAAKTRLLGLASSLDDFISNTNCRT